MLLAGAASSEVYMWKVPSGDCKVFGGSGEKSECGVILPDGQFFSLSLSSLVR